MIVCLFICTQEGTAIFLDRPPAPGEFISSQLVNYCLFVCLFVCSFTVLVYLIYINIYCGRKGDVWCLLPCAVLV